MNSVRYIRPRIASVGGSAEALKAVMKAAGFSVGLAKSRSIHPRFHMLLLCLSGGDELRKVFGYPWPSGFWVKLEIVECLFGFV